MLDYTVLYLCTWWSVQWVCFAILLIWQFLKSIVLHNTWQKGGNVQHMGLNLVKRGKCLHFDIMREQRNKKKRAESATNWQLKKVCRQKAGPFWERRQTDTNGGLGTWKSLGLAGIQGETGPVVWCNGPLQLRGQRRNGMTGINSLWLRQLLRLL